MERIVPRRGFLFYIGVLFFFCFALFNFYRAWHGWHQTQAWFPKAYYVFTGLVSVFLFAFLWAAAGYKKAGPVGILAFIVLDMLVQSWFGARNYDDYFALFFMILFGGWYFIPYWDKLSWI